MSKRQPLPVEDVRSMIERVAPDLPPFVMNSMGPLTISYLLFNNPSDLRKLRHQALLSEALELNSKGMSIDYLRNMRRIALHDQPHYDTHMIRTRMLGRVLHEQMRRQQQPPTAQ